MVEKITNIRGHIADYYYLVKGVMVTNLIIYKSTVSANHM